MKKIIFLMVFIILSFIFPSCIKEEDEIVKYEVICYPNGFDVTYQNGDGVIEQKTIASGNWSTSFVAHQGDYVSILAQSNNENAIITAKIYYKDRIIKQGSSSGDYAIVSVSCSLP